MRPAHPACPTCTRKTHKCPKSTTSIRAHRARPRAPDAARQAAELPIAPIKRSPRAAAPVDSAHARGLDRAIPVRHRPVTACANGDAMARRQRAAARGRAAGEGRGDRSGGVVGSSVPMGRLSGAGGGAHQLCLRRQGGAARHLHAPKCPSARNRRRPSATCAHGITARSYCPRSCPLGCPSDPRRRRHLNRARTRAG